MKSKALPSVVLLALICFVSRLDGTPILYSDFSSGDEGWTAVDVNPAVSYVTISGGPYPVIYSSSGGNPGGYISFTDRNAMLFLFDAPQIFLGDHNANYGGTLSFDVRRSAGVLHEEHPDVIMAGAGLVLVIDAGSGPAAQDQWTTYSVALSESDWRKGALNGPVPTDAEFRAVLGSLTALRIRGDFTDTFDLTGLDNVIITVPAPGAILLGTFGAGLVGWLRRRRRL